MNIRPDLLIHGKGGTIAVLGCCVVGYALLYVGLSPITVVALIGGFSAAVSVEASQRAANKAAIAAGLDARHEVSPLDAAASFAPAVPVAAAFEVAIRWLL